MARRRRRAEPADSPSLEDGVDIPQEALESQKKARKEASLASARASKELEQRMKCIDFERAARQEQTVQMDKLTTAKPNLKEAERSRIGDGSYVRVEEDLSPGKCSFGGIGFVQGEMAADGTFSVKYGENSNNKRVETGIPLDRLTELPYGATIHSAKPRRESAKRAPLAAVTTQNKPAVTTENKPPSKRSLVEELAYGARYNRSKGWRARDLNFTDTKFKDRSVRFKERVLRDLAELCGATGGTSDPSQTSRSSAGQFQKREKGQTRAYLCEAWGISERTLRTWVAADASGTLGERRKPQSKTIIDGSAKVEAHFAPKRMYIAHQVNLRREEEGGTISPEDLAAVKAELDEKWAVSVPASVKDEWHAKSRSSKEQLPLVKEQIAEALRANPTKSYQQLSADIGGILSATTIWRYLKKWGMRTYTQRPLPLCDLRQRQRQVAFAKRFLKRWDLEKQPILLIHFDEKWFEGTDAHTNAKECAELGVERKHPRMKHKSHPPKIMVVTVVAYAYDGDMENGGHGVKIGMYRCQKAKIAQRDQRVAVRDENGNLSYTGPLIRRKGDAYMVDCNVTGSNTGTSSDPKYALLVLFQETIFPTVAAIVGPGGKYEGHLPVFQGDNAGPHIDATFQSFVKTECERRGWKWEPQAPQMPHMNVLDLAVFPAMSIRHSKLLANYANTAAPESEIWTACQTVFADLNSDAIARGFVLAHRVAEKVVEFDGDNAFLRTKAFHSNVRKDFKTIGDGIVRK